MGRGGEVTPRRVRNDVRFFAALRLRPELGREGDPTGTVMCVQYEHHTDHNSCSVSTLVER